VRIAAILAVFVIGCSNASVPVPSASASAAGTRYGVAGLIPPHFPSPSAADYEILYTSLAGTGGAVGVYTAWADTGKEGAAPAVVAASAAAAAKYHFGPVVIALGVTQDAPGGVKSSVDWSGPQRDRFVAAATAVARERPEFLALGVESNRLWMSDQAAFDGFVKAYADAYDAIKKVSPATKVFTIFQLELMRGAAFLATAKQSTPPQWDLLARFSGKLDLVGYTTYPFLAFANPADIPEDYYADAARRSAAPIAFTEVGWPSADLGGAAAGSPYGGTPQEQSEFVTRFLALTAGVRPTLALWSFPNDLGPAAPSTFSSVGLRLNDGTAKSALIPWQRAAVK
jgi:hypothetical protein